MTPDPMADLDTLRRWRAAVSHAAEISNEDTLVLLELRKWLAIIEHSMERVSSTEERNHP